MPDIILGVKETSSNKAEKTACFSTLALCGHRGGTVWAQRWHWEGIEVALGGHRGGTGRAYRWHCAGIEVALGGHTGGTVRA